MTLFLFILTQLSIALFAVALAWHPEVRPLPWPAKLSLLFLSGAIVMTVDATLLSTLHLSWGERTLPLPIILLTPIVIRRWRKLPAAEPSWSRGGWSLGTIVPLLAALAHLTIASLFGIINSIDFIFFWGVKAARFATARGIEVPFLASPFAIHSHVIYPQLVPITLSWSALFLDDRFWSAATMSGALWLILTLPLLIFLLRRRLAARDSVITTLFWSIAISCSLAASYSAGNAEAQLVCYASIATAALLSERADDRFSRICAAIGIAGLLMTKQEGAFVAIFLALGWLAREWRTRDQIIKRALGIFALPLLAASSWWIFQLVNRLPLTDPARESTLFVTFEFLPNIFLGMLKNLSAGTYGLSWLLITIFLFDGRRRWRAILPALSVVAGSFALYFFYYLHSTTDPTELIGWTLGRVIQPALAAAILAAAFATFAAREKSEAVKDQLAA